VVSGAVPNNWGASLTPSSTFIDLLSGPDAQQASLNQTIRFLQQQIFGWNAVIAQIPAGSQADIAQALKAFNAASSSYNTAVSDVLSSYTNNAVLAVQIYAASEEGTEDTDQVNQLYGDLEQQNPADPPGPASLNADDIGAIVAQVRDAQKALISSNSSMVASGINLANAATAFLQSQSGAPLRTMLTPIIDQLTSQLSLVQSQAAAFQASCVRAAMLMGNGAKTVPGNLYNPSAAAGEDQGMPSKASSIVNQNWQYVTIEFNAADLETASQSSTYFDQMDWSVDLFFGSAGGQSTSQGSSFASSYLSSGGKVRIGMLATKVLIDRPWMHPEIFNLSSSYFRVAKDRLTTPDPIAAGYSAWDRNALIAADMFQPPISGSTTTEPQATAATLAINKGPFPCYPVALLIAKDVTIQIECDLDKTNALSQQSQEVSTEGGGFLCFSVSETQATSSSSNSAGSYATAGSYVFRITAPQIIGTWLQITPDDLSEPLSPDLANDIAKALGFVSRLKAVSNAPRATFQVPQRPASKN